MNIVGKYGLCSREIALKCKNLLFLNKDFCQTVIFHGFEAQK